MGRGASRAGRTGGSWYGSYRVHYADADGEHQYDVTSKRFGEQECRLRVARGAIWAELRGDAVMYRRARHNASNGGE